jgi:hypothetical protein
MGSYTNLLSCEMKNEYRLLSAMGRAIRMHLDSPPIKNEKPR